MPVVYVTPSAVAVADDETTPDSPMVIAPPGASITAMCPASVPRCRGTTPSGAIATSPLAVAAPIQGSTDCQRPSDPPVRNIGAATSWAWSDTGPLTVWVSAVHACSSAGSCGSDAGPHTSTGGASGFWYGVGRSTIGGCCHAEGV